MTQRIDVRTNVRPQSNRVRSRTCTARIDVVAMFLVQTVEVRGVGRMMRRTGVVRLREVNCAAILESGKQVTDRHDTSVSVSTWYPRRLHDNR